MRSSFKAIDKGRTALSGFYQVGEVALANKLEALYLASKEKKLPYWNFHDDVFKNFDWTTKPLKTIEQVYKERAQQLRDKYDYISISFSGGADSWNVLNSFLSNNIHVDEIYTRFPLAGTRKHMAANNTDFSARNLTSEYEYAVKPILEYVEKHFPKTKIIVDDITESYYDEVTEDEIIRTGHFALNGLSAKRCANNIGSNIDFDNKKVASIRGSGKFQLRKNENTFFIYFSDIEAWPVDADPNFNLEYFYWSPEATELLALQAHLLKEYFISHQDLMWVIEANPMTNPTIMAYYQNIRSIYNSIYKQVCYPQWNPNTFQTDKASGIQFEREDDFWIMSENAKSVQSWKWTVDQFYKSLHERAFYMIHNNPNCKRLKIFASPKYIINKY
jgi:hypothetical protein